ncbi:MAG: hypothetical protein AB1603_04730 [Chloroflexota bacterium]
MGWLKLQYLILVFLTSCGLLQGVFSCRKVSGLQFFPRRYQGCIFSIVTTVGAFVWFYATGDRNTLPVIEGSQQFGLFIAGAAAAAAFTVVFSSMVNHWRSFSRAAPEASAPEAGLDDLKRMTYLRAIPMIASELWSTLVDGLRRWRGIGRG